MTHVRKPIIFAHGLHSGGGASVLLSLIKTKRAQDCLFILDDRLRSRLPENTGLTAHFFPAGLIGRLRAETWLKAHSDKDTKILSLNSLPFLRHQTGKVTYFFHNVNLLTSQRGIAPALSVSSWAKRVLFTCLIGRLHHVIVQTPTVKEQMLQRFDRLNQADIRIHGFVPPDIASPQPEPAPELLGHC